jgi:hypothetical protein
MTKCVVRETTTNLPNFINQSQNTQNIGKMVQINMVPRGNGKQKSDVHVHGKSFRGISDAAWLIRLNFNVS